MKLSILCIIYFTISITIVSSEPLELFRQTHISTSYYSGTNEYETKILCVSDNSSDAVIFNEPLVNNTVKDKKYQEVFDVIIGFDPDGHKCQIEMDHSNCLSEWKNDSNWKVVSSLEAPMGPVYDKRWEHFQEYEKILHANSSYSFVAPEKSDNFFFESSENKNALVVSIRGTANANFLLCKSRNYRSDFCYWVIIGGWDNTVTGIRKCEKGIPIGKLSSGSDCSILRASKAKYLALDGLEWRTFIITWNKNKKTVNLYDSEELIISFTDSANAQFNITQILYGNLDRTIPMLFRFHEYEYILSKKTNSMLISPPLTSNYGNRFCIEALIGLCPNCELTIKLIDGSSSKKISQTFGSLFSNQTIKHGLFSWQYARFDVEDINEYELPLTVQIITKVNEKLEIDHDQYHWALGNIRECASEKSLRQLLFMNNTRQPRYSNFNEPNVACQKFSYNKSQAVIVRNRLTNFEPPNNATLCSDLRIGAHCKISCSQYFTASCRSVSKCDQFGCYCVQGSRGNKCGDDCSNGFYGYGCKKQCQNCAGYQSGHYYYRDDKVCSPYDGKCSKGCQESTTFFVPPYCNVEITPTVPTIDFVNEMAVRVSVQEVKEVDELEDIGLLVIFEIETATGREKGESVLAEKEQTNSTTEEKYFATFTNLTSGQKYFVKTIFNVEYDNKHKLIESSKESFTTACNWDKRFEIEPNTTGLLIKRVHEEEDYVCPDEWYEVQVTMKSYNNETEEISVGLSPLTFPLSINHLKPYTHYNVCVSNFDANFQNCQTVSTLEEEPSKVQNLHVKEVNARDVLIAWSPPLEPNGIIQNYHIIISVLYYNGCERKNLNTPDNLLLSHIYMDISPANLSQRIDNLSPFVTYEVQVIAENSKMGSETTIIIATEELAIPSETFDDLKLEKDKLSWKYPKDCSKVTGRIEGARLFLVGLSEHVQNYSTKQDLYENSFTLSDKYIFGAEKYQVRVHVLRYLYEHHNETAYSELIFTTNPRPPPQVEDLTIVEVDQQNKTLTIRWREPKPPLNGEISYYGVKFPLDYTDSSHQIIVYPNETCKIWSDFICKTIDQPFGERKSIKILAYNKGAENSGTSTEIDYQKHEIAPEAPKIISIEEIDKGVVELRWKHPWITGGPLKKFLIIEELILTILEIGLRPSNKIKVIEYYISEYQPEYSTRLYLLPSTHYNISIKAATNLTESPVTNVTISTKATVNFAFEPTIKRNQDGLTFDVFIPPIVNNSYASMTYIIVKGTPGCKNPSSAPYLVSERNLTLGYHEKLWSAAGLPTFKIENRSFTIGDNETVRGVTNCPLREDSSYTVMVLIRTPPVFIVDSTNQLIWKSQLIKTEIIYKSHLSWSVPLIIFIIICLAGVAFYFIRIRPKRKSSGPEIQMNSVDTKTDNDNDFRIQVLSPVDTTDNTDLISVNSIYP